jgi:hypothetical protein
MTRPVTPRALTVLVVPRARTEDIVAVLGDYSAVGLLGAFAWVDAADTGGASTPATLVRDGRSEPVVLQQLLTGERYDRIRVAVLVPTDAPATERVPLAAEQAVEQVARSSAMGARVGLLRLLLTTGHAVPLTPDATLILEGWHNLLVAPEDSSGPGLGAVPWGRLSDPLDLARQIAPVVAGVTGLWAGVGHTPFDNLEILPGQTVRAVRAFYRRLDSSNVEERLRAQLFDPAGRVPLPRGGQIPVVYVNDVPAAAQTMARALWTKHRDVLRGPRMASSDAGAQAISIWAALKMFLKFMGAALRSAPSAWWSAVSGGLSSVLASTVQGTVFGGRESAFEVVTNTDVANWQDLGRNAESLSSAIGGTGQSEHLAHHDLSALWTDYVNGALTLADGGRRAAGMEPIQVGSGIGVLANAADVVPSPAENFTGIPTSLAAVVGVSAVEGADVLGAATLSDRLRRAYSDPSAGVEARTAGTDLERWQGHTAKSYAWQVSTILADFMNRARTEVAQLAEQIQRAANQTSVDERLRARQKAIGTILKTFTWALFAVLMLLAGAGALGWVRWKFALTTGGVLLALYVIVSLGLFLFIQRDLFAEMNLRQSQLTQLETMQANLRAALQDVSRLSTAYGQLLAWSRTLGTVLRAPFGAPPPTRHAAGQLADGLPRCTQIGVADPSAEQADDAIHAIQRRLYALGWLTQPWQELVEDAAGKLREDPEALFRMPGIGTGSGLDQWSTALVSGRVQPSGADALWSRVEQMFVEDAAIADKLTGSVLVPTLGRQVTAQQFGAGMIDHRAGAAAPFDASLFTNAATTAGRTAVAVDEPALVPGGLGYRAAVVQASDGLPPYDFALFEVPLDILPGSEDEVTTMISRSEGPKKPPGEDMVF